MGIKTLNPNLKSANPSLSCSSVFWRNVNFLIRFTTVWIRAAADSDHGRRTCVFNRAAVMCVRTRKTYNWQTSCTGNMTSGAWSSPTTKGSLTTMRTIWTSGFWKESRSEFATKNLCSDFRIWFYSFLPKFYVIDWHITIYHITTVTFRVFDWNFMRHNNKT